MNNPLAVVAAGFIAGIFSGFFGIGGGTVMVPALTYFWKLSQHRATATSLAVILPVGIVGSIIYQTQGSLDIPLAVKIAAGSVLGAHFGSKLSCRLPGPILKKLFGAVLIITGIRMVMG